MLGLTEERDCLRDQSNGDTGKINVHHDMEHHFSWMSEKKSLKHEGLTGELRYAD
jgi:hypothetical protein